MARLGRLGFLGIAVVFHVVYILSIFDIYFTSPIVSGMRAYSVDAPKAPAKRLVLYVGDGLRADKAFQFFPDPSPGAANDSSAQELRPLAPFLRSRVLEHGTFGVSHTRVPTESRPGHVALIAGLYEDVSAVTTGWKLNPVNFDSVFNRSRHTWSWGSPDILPMFSTGATPGRVTDDTYGSEFEDFSKDATELDYYVFDHVKQLFKSAETDAKLNAKLREDKVVFFLHLLGLDTTGHAYRPYSREYLHNIKIVDEGVKEITKIIDDFYGDDETAYVFTADHGMSDWGSHGDGHPDNTRTPLITWGAGVAKPKTVASGKAPGHEDGFSHDWHLDRVQRHDVAQADIATLMAYLAGLEFPVNSVGELPLSYLAAGDEEKAKAILVNAREILEMYRVKEEKKKATVLRYKPYRQFASANQTTDKRLAHIEQTIRNGQYNEAIKASDDLIQLGLQALRYLQTYDWLFLRALVTAGYLGWIAFAFTTAVDMHMLDGKVEASRTSASIIAFASVLVGLYSFLFIQSSPVTYYAYALFPVMFWEEVFVRRQALVEGKNKLFAKVSQQDVVKLALNAAAYVGVLEIMVQSYYHREIYTVCYVLAASWPVFYGLDFLRANWMLCATWALGCSAMSIFTLLPAIKIEDDNLILLGGMLILIAGVLYLAMEKSLLAAVAPSQHSAGPDGLSRTILGVQVGLVALAMLVTRSSVASLRAKQGLPLGTQWVGWFTLAISRTSHEHRPSTGSPPARQPAMTSIRTNTTGTTGKSTKTCSKRPGHKLWPLHRVVHGVEALLVFHELKKHLYEEPKARLLRRRRARNGKPDVRRSSTDFQTDHETKLGAKVPTAPAAARDATSAAAAYAYNHTNTGANPAWQPPSGQPPMIASLSVPFLHALAPCDDYLHRLAVIFLAFGPLFVILTISYEGLFYVAIAVTLVTWVRLEHCIREHVVRSTPAPAQKPHTAQPLLDMTDPLASLGANDGETARDPGSSDLRPLTLSDTRISLFFLFLLQSAFFSTGNIASISSFSLDAVYRLLPVFDPFSQGALLLLKLLAPFALVSANLGILTKRLRLRGGSLFAVVMGIGDYLTLRFFWEVRDEGSWLEIGESISMFVIASMLCVFVAGLEGLSGVFVRGVAFRR
ncbi:hypothetical protein LTR08_004798 [Meristemomyces frigidus]|nr:hypothetical protein LTR08_004798 [Meristemomyces frigidus]